MGVMKRCSALLLRVLIVLLIAATWPSLETSAQSQAPPPLGFHIARGDAAHVQAARQAGGSFAVLVFSWRDIQPLPDRFYWETPDAALRTAQFYGLDVIARLDQPPDWALDENDPTPWNLDAYASFASQVAQRYGERLAGLILWNEPNLSLEWAGQRPDPAAYAELLATAYPAVKAAAPDLPVLMAGLAATLGDGDRASNDLDFLQAVYDAGGGAHFDALAAHPYGFGQPPEQAPAAGRLNFRRLELLRAIMEANGDAAKPVWISEMGWRTRAPSDGEAWEVVTPQQQAAYTLAALDWARQRYPWVARIGLWELNGVADDYGFALWEGPGKTTPVFAALAQRAADAPQPRGFETNRGAAVEILAPDVAIRLGDVGTLHPHWVHLHRGGDRFSPNWRGEFFLSQAQAGQDFDLLLETLQVDQPTNRVLVNGQMIGRLQPRMRAEVTSTWVTQRLPVPAGLLQPGANTLTVVAGQRNPARQLATWRWENMMLRHIRLAPAPVDAPAAALEWSPLPSPGSWAETIRLRRGLDGELWLTGNRAGQLWRIDGGQARLEAGDRPETVFVDVLATEAGLLAATDQGLLWRPAGSARWQPAAQAPGRFAYAVMRHNGAYYAGFEGRGLWWAAQPQGPWRPAGLAARTVHDVVALDARRLAVATDIGVAVQPAGPTLSRWRFLPRFPDPQAGDAAARSGDRLVQRLFTDGAGALVARQHARLWRWDAVQGDWLAYGPAGLAGQLASLADCCGQGALTGSEEAGLWQRTAGGWQRLDSGVLSPYPVTDLLRADGALFAATPLGLLSSGAGRDWQVHPGLAAVMTDLAVDPAQPDRWIAGTLAGVYVSGDRGASWDLVSPPWKVYQLAWGPQGRLFVAHGAGLVWSDDLAAAQIDWQQAGGLDRVTFFSANPHPEQAGLVWAGTWGNNVAASSDDGATVAPLHNGLETLSALDILWHPTPGQATIATIEGLFRTDDGGASWFKLPGPLMQQTVHSLMQTPDGAIWAGAADGLWRSDDYGASWQAVDGLPAMTVLRLGELALPDQAASWLWAGTEGEGVWLSNDGGTTWLFGGLAGRSVARLLADPARPGWLLAASDAGLFSSPMVPLELFHHLQPMVGDAAGLYRYEIDALVRYLGMTTAVGENHDNP